MLKSRVRAFIAGQTGVLSLGFGVYVATCWVADRMLLRGVSIIGFVADDGASF